MFTKQIFLLNFYRLNLLKVLMNKKLLTILAGLICGLNIGIVRADPPMQPFYADVMKMTPQGKLGQVIKQESIATSVKGAQAWRIAYISSDIAGRKTISTGLVVASGTSSSRWTPSDVLGTRHNRFSTKLWSIASH
jgi:hypothetical protein